MKMKLRIAPEQNATDSAHNPLFEYIRYTEFKRLLNKFISEQQKTGFKSVTVLSELSGEGKTFVVSALALGYATLLDKRILIVDTISQTRDRSLYLERIFGRLEKNNSAKEVPHCFQIIDLISTQNMEKDTRESSDFLIGPYISTLKDKYDLILFDTCAMNKANKNNLDPVIIAKNSDISILVTSYDSMAKDKLGKLKSRLEQWDIKPLGTVFNTFSTNSNLDGR